MEIERVVKALQDKGIQLEGLAYKDVHLIVYNLINEKVLVSEANAIVEKIKKDGMNDDLLYEFKKCAEILLNTPDKRIR